MPILRFEPNTPCEVALRYPSGKHVNGTYGEQVLYSLQDGRIMYVPIIVEKKLQELNVKRGQAVEICKAQADGKTEWQVRRVETRPKPAARATSNGHAQPAAELLDQSKNLDGEHETDIPESGLELALKISLQAAKSAEKFSQDIGHPIQFDKNDIRLLATTLVINSRGRAA